MVKSATRPSVATIAMAVFAKQRGDLGSVPDQKSDRGRVEGDVKKDGRPDRPAQDPHVAHGQPTQEIGQGVAQIAVRTGEEERDPDERDAGRVGAPQSCRKIPPRKNISSTTGPMQARRDERGPSFARRVVTSRNCSMAERACSERGKSFWVTLEIMSSGA